MLHSRHRLLLENELSILRLCDTPVPAWVVVSLVQVQAQLAEQQAHQARQTAADALATSSLCRRILRHFRAAAAASAAWREVKLQANQHSQQALQRRAVQLWRRAATRQRQLQVLQMRWQRQQRRAVMTAWLQLLLMQR
jgi:hypothetical protein